MKVLSLQCGLRHPFEGWFVDEADFQHQVARGILTCPLCGHHEIVKLPSAPHLNLRSDPRDTQLVDATGTVATSSEPDAQALQTAVWQALRHLVRQSDNVGDRFADEALAMHRGDIEARSIRGRATQEQTQQLLDEGVDVVPLPQGLDDPLH